MKIDKNGLSQSYTFAYHELRLAGSCQLKFRLGTFGRLRCPSASLSVQTASASTNAHAMGQQQIPQTSERISAAEIEGTCPST